MANMLPIPNNVEASMISMNKANGLKYHIFLYLEICLINTAVLEEAHSRIHVWTQIVHQTRSCGRQDGNKKRQHMCGKFHLTNNSFIPPVEEATSCEEIKAQPEIVNVGTDTTKDKNVSKNCAQSIVANCKWSSPFPLGNTGVKIRA